MRNNTNNPTINHGTNPAVNPTANRPIARSGTARRVVLALVFLAGLLVTSVAAQPASAEAIMGRKSPRTAPVPAPQPIPPSQDIDIQPVLRGSGGRGSSPGPGHDSPPGLVDPGGPSAGISADCFVDFEDELVLEWTILDSAADTIMRTPWYQKCQDGPIYPAIAVKWTYGGHFHLGYTDTRIGPCEWDLTDWGRKSTPSPHYEDPDYADWMFEPCVEEIDPTTEPRNGIRPHEPGEVVQVYAYDDEDHLPFSLKTLQVVEGEVEVCHLPPGPHEAAGPGGSPWECFELGVGYWGLEALVDNAIEVRIEYLTAGELNNIGIDLL